MKKNKLVGLLTMVALVALFLGGDFALAESQTGTLEILGVPTEIVTGRYDSQAGVFWADVSELEEALILVKFEEVQIFGKKMEWRTKDNYLIFSKQAKLNKEDFELTGDVIEYFGDEKKLTAQGSVVVVTEDATIYADHLLYNEKSDEALFTGKVKVIFTDGTLEGEKFLMLLEKSELQFFGSFQGEFNTDSN